MLLRCSTDRAQLALSVDHLGLARPHIRIVDELVKSR